MGSSMVYDVKRIADDLYVMTETGSVHCYVVIGTERALLFDVGYGYEDIHPLLEEITDVPVMLALSHGDPDHSLGAGWFEDVWLHPLDWGKVLVNDTVEMRRSALDYRLAKMPELRGYLDEEAFMSRRIRNATPHFVCDGDVIDLGGTKLEVLHTPGHSYGHIMLLDRAHGRLFSGDQVSAHNIWYFDSSDGQAPFAQAVSSLKRLLSLRESIEAIFPAHGEMPIGIEAIEDQLACLEHELAETYRDDERFEAFIGKGGWRHRYRSCELIYSDERLGEWLGHPIER